MRADIYLQCVEACWVYSKCSISVVCLWVKPDQVVFCTVVCARLSSRETYARKVKKHTCSEVTGHMLKKDDLQAGALNIGRITFSEHFPNHSVHRYEYEHLLHAMQCDRHRGHKSKQYTLPSCGHAHDQPEKQLGDMESELSIC